MEDKQQSFEDFVAEVDPLAASAMGAVDKPAKDDLDPLILDLPEGRVWNTAKKNKRVVYLGHDIINAENYLMILGLGCRLRYEEFDEQVEINLNDRWEPINAEDYPQIYRMVDVAWNRYHYKPSEKAIDRAIVNLAKENSYHRVLQAIDNTEWDGIKRITDTKSTDDNTIYSALRIKEEDELSREMIRVWLYGHYGRLRIPGMTFQYIFVLVGPQGVGKDETIERITMNNYTNAPSFRNSIDSIEKKIAEQSKGKMSFVVNELGVMKGQTLANFKSFVTTKEIDTRVAWGRKAEKYPAQYVLTAGTNNQEFLKDVENRRFMVIPVDNPIDFQWIEDNILQIYAEVQHHYEQSGKKTVRLREEFWPLVAKRNLGYQVYDMADVYITEMLENINLMQIRSADFDNYCGMKNISKPKAREILRVNGFEDKVQKIHDKPRRVWQRPESSGHKVVTTDGKSRKANNLWDCWGIIDGQPQKYSLNTQHPW